MKKRIALLLILAFIMSTAGCARRTSPGYFGTLENTNRLMPEPKLAEMDQVERTVIIDSPIARVTVLGTYNVGFELLYENFSSDEMYFRTDILSVNNYTMPIGYFGGETVAANDKIETSEWVADKDLLELGIRSISNIEIECSVKVDDDYGYDTLYTEKKHFVFESSSNVDTHDSCFVESIKDGTYEALTDRKIDFFSEDEIFYEDGLRIITTALTEDNQLLLEFENTTKTDIDISLDNFTVNGIILNNYPSSSPAESETILANTYYVSEIDINPPELVRICFGIDSIADITFIVDTGLEEVTKASVCIPDRNGTLDTSGYCFCTCEDVDVTYKGIYYKEASAYKIDETTYDSHYEYYDLYKMVLYVENKCTEEVFLELAADSLFLNYRKTAFSTYETITGHENYHNFGTVPAGYCGYIILELDAESMQENGLRDVSAIKNVEMNMLLTEGHYGDIIASGRFEFVIP